MSRDVRYETMSQLTPTFTAISQWLRWILVGFYVYAFCIAKLFKQLSSANALVLLYDHPAVGR